MLASDLVLPVASTLFFALALLPAGSPYRLARGTRRGDHITYWTFLYIDFKNN